MAKKKKEVELKEVSRTEVNGTIIIKYEDGSVKIIPAHEKIICLSSGPVHDFVPGCPPRRRPGAGERKAAAPGSLCGPHPGGGAVPGLPGGDSGGPGRSLHRVHVRGGVPAVFILRQRRHGGGHRCIRPKRL